MNGGIAVFVGAFVTPEALLVAVATLGIALVGGIIVDRAIAWSRYATTRRDEGGGA